MVSLALDIDLHPDNPLDLLEDFVNANAWWFERLNDSELAVQVSGRWGDFDLCFVWHEQFEAVYFACHLDLRVPQGRRREVQNLVSLVNERLWLGHFELGLEDGETLFRHTLPLRGTEGMSLEQLEDLIEAALTECDRFYPALQLVARGGQPASQAIAATMMDTVGSA